MKSAPVPVTIKSPQPATDFPGTMLHAHLKQIDIPALEARTRQAIEECFPQFASDPSRDWHKSLRAHGANVQPDNPVNTAFTAGGYYDLTQGRFRRYAGGKDLPGARYFALCRDASGNDGGTLCYELMSYWDSTSGWFLGLTDSTVHREAIAQSPLTRVLADQDPVLLIIASPIDEIKVGKTREPFPTGQTHPILVPLRVVEISCDNVLDLRFPDAQEWLAQRCGGKGSHSSFLELLPNLISPSPGGNAFHQNIGGWLRTHGCLGLVFPSARRDVFVESSAAGIVSHDGWNFVSYHGVESPSLTTTLGPPFPWLNSARIGIDLFTNREGDAWYVKGAEIAEWGRINYEIRRSRGQAPAPSVTFSPFDDGRRTRAAEGTLFGPLEPD